MLGFTRRSYLIPLRSGRDAQGIIARAESVGCAAELLNRNEIRRYLCDDPCEPLNQDVVIVRIHGLTEWDMPVVVYGSWRDYLKMVIVKHKYIFKRGLQKIFNTSPLTQASG